jgi:hypothetical protein
LFPALDKFVGVNRVKSMKTEVEREWERELPRARQNIEEIHAIQQEVRERLEVLRALQAEGRKIAKSSNGVNESTSKLQ